MTTCFPKVDYTLWDRFIIRLLQKGQMPQHIAFILDGNRRFAKKFNSTIFSGYSKGFVKFTRIWSLCREMDISSITIYAMSIENFQRSKVEVALLFEIFCMHFEKLIEELYICDAKQICVQFHGKLNLLPEKLQKLIAQISLHTAKHNKFRLNICLPYTSREEIQNGLADLQECAQKEIIDPADINNKIFSASLYSCEIRDPDIVLRSSGEIRLSDFQLWQSGFSHIAFVQNLWPGITHGDIYKEIFKFQLNYRSILQCRKRFYENLWRNEFENNRIYSKSLTFENYRVVKKEKLAIFFEYIKLKRSAYMETLLDGNKI